MVKRVVWSATALLLAIPATLQADYVRVGRPATIKENPERLAEILQRASRGDEFELVSLNQTNGYYEVAVPGRAEPGWIYRTLVRRHRGAPVAAGGTVASASTTPTPTPAVSFTSGRLEVHIIDIGQGDAVLVRCPDGTHELLIDSGELNFRYPGSATEFRQYMVAHQGQNNRIEVALSSHPHSDHIGSMAWVLEQYTVELYVDNHNMAASTTFGNVETAFAAAQARVGTQYWGAQELSAPEIDFCPRDDVSAQVIRQTDFGHDHDPNNNSVIVRVDYADNSFLFVGDAEVGAETALREEPAIRALLDTDFLKVGHHGSSTSSTQEFLDLVSPTVSAISCGRRGVGTNRNHQHPRADVVRRLLQQAGARDGPALQFQAFNSTDRVWEMIDLDRAVYVTAVMGDLVFESDGHGIRLRPQ